MSGYNGSSTLINNIRTPNGDLVLDETNDAIRVNVVAGGGSGGTSATDDAAFTPASGAVNPIGAFADETAPDSVDEGDVGIVRMTLARALHVNIRDNAGDSCMDETNNAVRVNTVAGGGSGGTSATDEAAFTEGTTPYTPIGGVYNETLTDPAGEDWAAAARITIKRALHSNLRNVAGTEIGTATDPVRIDPTGTTTQPVSGTVTANLAAGTNNIGDVDVLTLPALPAGTNNIGDVDVLTLPALPAGTNNIGDVDVLTLPAIPAGTNNIGDVDIASFAAGAIAEVQGDVAHDAVIAGNPVTVGGVGETMADSAPGNRASADGDAVRLATDLDGVAYVHPHGPQVWSYHSNGSAALTDASVHAAPGAGLSLYVGTVAFSSGAATAINIFFEEGASTVLGPWYLEAVAGRGMAFTFNPPKKITANTALTVTTSAAIAHSVDVSGYVAPG